MEPFHHAAGIRPESATATRWPRINTVRCTSLPGRLRWRTRAGPFRTRRAAMRRARALRDADGIRYTWTPGALAWGVLREQGKWWVLSRPTRGKPSPPTTFADAFQDPPF